MVFQPKSNSDSNGGGTAMLPSPVRETVTPTMFISQNAEEQAMQQNEARGNDGMPSQTLDLSPRLLPYAKRPDTIESYTDHTGKSARGCPDCSEVTDKFDFIWSGKDDIKSGQGIQGLGVVVNRNGTGNSYEASKYIFGDYFGPDGRVWHKTQVLRAVDKAAVKKLNDRVYSHVTAGLDRMASKGSKGKAGEDGMSRDEAIITEDKELEL